MSKVGLKAEDRALIERVLGTGPDGAPWHFSEGIYFEEDVAKLLAHVGALLAVAQMAMENAVMNLANRGRFGAPDDALAGLRSTLDALKSDAALSDHRPPVEALGVREAAREIDRFMLVIESAVRNADPRNHSAVLAALKANRAALSTAPLSLGNGKND